MFDNELDKKYYMSEDVDLEELDDDELGEEDDDFDDEDEYDEEDDEY